MPSTLRYLKGSRGNIKLFFTVFGICSLVYTLKDRLVDGNDFNITSFDIFNGKANLDQRDTNVIDYVRNNMLSHPQPFNRDHERDITQGQHNQAHFVDSYLKGMTSGFFVEAGAWDGVYLSNSLFFEKTRNWTGVLVEPNVEAYKNLSERSGRSTDTWCLNACLSTTPYPQKVDFNAADVFSGVEEKDTVLPEGLKSLRDSLPESMRKVYQMQCLPVFTIIAAATKSKHPVVDYFSLDVEGAELSILKTIPWDSITIRTMSIEVQHSDAAAIEELMIKNKFKVVQRIANVDIIFARDDL